MWNMSMSDLRKYVYHDSDFFSKEEISEGMERVHALNGNTWVPSIEYFAWDAGATTTPREGEIDGWFE